MCPKNFSYQFYFCLPIIRSIFSTFKVWTVQIIHQSIILSLLTIQHDEPYEEFILYSLINAAYVIGKANAMGHSFCASIPISKSAHISKNKIFTLSSKIKSIFTTFIEPCIQMIIQRNKYKNCYIGNLCIDFLINRTE